MKKFLMKAVLVGTLLGSTYFCEAQEPIRLPKSILKNWVFIPKIAFSSQGIYGNDSVNFVKTERNIQTEAFYIFDKEVSNELYRAFVKSVNNAQMKPDTNTWMSDFKLSYNEPMRTHYYSHPKYEDYPVVGISQNQALAYCKWLQDKYNAELAGSDKYKEYICIVSLPTDKEWESAFYYTYQKDEKNPYQSAYIISKNVYVSEKKQSVNYGQDITKEHFVVREYIIDGGLFPLRYNQFKPAKNGIYNLAGNVAEWTLSTAYNQTDSSYLKIDKNLKQLEFVTKSKGKSDSSYKSDLDDFNNPEKLKLIYEKDGYYAVKGGSWCHSIFYLEPAVSIYCKPTDQHSYIGFRPVMKIIRK